MAAGWSSLGESSLCFTRKKIGIDAVNWRNEEKWLWWAGTTLRKIFCQVWAWFSMLWECYVLTKAFVFLLTAACYGRGTYFAVDASYSANDKYSIPDSKGRKRIYVVRVLTGDYTHGQTGMLTPPSKNSDNTKDTYDSVTDDINQPKLFVIFSDYQAYPEYLVTLSKR